MIRPTLKKSLVGQMFPFLGAVFFFLVVPFGIIFGVLHRLFGGAHRSKDRSS